MESWINDDGNGILQAKWWCIAQLQNFVPVHQNTGVHIRDYDWKEGCKYHHSIREDILSFYIRRCDIVNILLYILWDHTTGLYIHHAE